MIYINAILKVFHEQNLIFQILLTPITIELTIISTDLIEKLSNSSLIQSQARAIPSPETNSIQRLNKPRFSGS